MRITLPALLAILALAVTLACGSSSDIKAPSNQSYRFEGLTAVINLGRFEGSNPLHRLLRRFLRR